MAIDHPIDEDLQRWLRDQLPGDLGSEIESHLSSCEHCGERLNRLEDPDAMLMEKLRHSFDGDRVDGHHLGGDTLETRWTVFQGEGFQDERGARDSFARDFSSARWSLRSLIGRGGIGEVWLCHDSLLGQHVALKRLRPEVASRRSVQDRFLREARVTAKLAHPGIPTVFDLHLDGARSYYVMSLVEGHTLTRAITDWHQVWKATGELPMSRLLGLLGDLVSIGKAVAFAHANGVVHRDLKSDNIVVGEFGQVTLVDWGLAKFGADEFDDDQREEVERADEADAAGRDRSGVQEAGYLHPGALEAESTSKTDPALTMQGARLGTPAFMAPEQARGDNVSVNQQTDVYGLAAILYEILTGGPPFDVGDVDQVLMSVLAKDPERPSKTHPEIPAELEDIAMWGLQKDPADRQRSAVEFVEQLESWVTSESIRRETEVARAQFFSLTSDLMVIHDFRGNIHWVNPAMEVMLDRSPIEVIGHPISELVHASDFDLVSEGISKVTQGDSVSGIEVRMICRDGSHLWMSWTATPFPDDDLVYAIGRSVHARRKREQQAAGLLDAAPDALVVISSDQRIRLINRQAVRMFGYTSDELIGKKVDVLLPLRARAVHEGHVGDYLLNPTTRPLNIFRPLTGLHKDGTELTVSISLSPLETEDGLLVSAAIRPVAGDDASGPPPSQVQDLNPLASVRTSKQNSETK